MTIIYFELLLEKLKIEAEKCKQRAVLIKLFLRHWVTWGKIIIDFLS